MRLKPIKIDNSKRDKHLQKRDGKYYFVNADGNENELKGMHCKAFRSGENYYFQFDVGHFMTKFVDVKISENDFKLLRNGELSFDDLQKKYSTQVS